MKKKYLLLPLSALLLTGCFGSGGEHNNEPPIEEFINPDVVNDDESSFKGTIEVSKGDEKAYLLLEDKKASFTFVSLESKQSVFGIDLEKRENYSYATIGFAGDADGEDGDSHSLFFDVNQHKYYFGTFFDCLRYGILNIVHEHIFDVGEIVGLDHGYRCNLYEEKDGGNVWATLELNDPFISVTFGSYTFKAEYTGNLLKIDFPSKAVSEEKRATLLGNFGKNLPDKSLFKLTSDQSKLLSLSLSESLFIDFYFNVFDEDIMLELSFSGIGSEYFIYKKGQIDVYHSNDAEKPYLIFKHESDGFYRYATKIYDYYEDELEGRITSPYYKSKVVIDDYTSSMDLHCVRSLALLDSLKDHVKIDLSDAEEEARTGGIRLAVSDPSIVSLFDPEATEIKPRSIFYEISNEGDFGFSIILDNIFGLYSYSVEEGTKMAEIKERVVDFSLESLLDLYKTDVSIRRQENGYNHYIYEAFDGYFRINNDESFYSNGSSFYSSYYVFDETQFSKKSFVEPTGFYDFVNIDNYDLSDPENITFSSKALSITDASVSVEIDYYDYMPLIVISQKSKRFIMEAYSSAANYNHMRFPLPTQRPYSLKDIADKIKSLDSFYCVTGDWIMTKYDKVSEYSKYVNGERNAYVIDENNTPYALSDEYSLAKVASFEKPTVSLESFADFVESLVLESYTVGGALKVHSQSGVKGTINVRIDGDDFEVDIEFADPVIFDGHSDYNFACYTLNRKEEFDFSQYEMLPGIPEMIEMLGSLESKSYHYYTDALEYRDYQLDIYKNGVEKEDVFYLKGQSGYSKAYFNEDVDEFGWVLEPEKELPEDVVLPDLSAIADVEQYVGGFPTLFQDDYVRFSNSNNSSTYIAYNAYFGRLTISIEGHMYEFSSIGEEEFKITEPSDEITNMFDKISYFRSVTYHQDLEVHIEISDGQHFMSETITTDYTNEYDHLKMHTNSSQTTSITMDGSPQVETQSGEAYFDKDDSHYYMYQEVNGSYKKGYTNQTTYEGLSLDHILEADMMKFVINPEVYEKVSEGVYKNSSVQETLYDPNFGIISIPKGSLICTIVSTRAIQIEYTGALILQGFEYGYVHSVQTFSKISSTVINLPVVA